MIKYLKYLLSKKWEILVLFTFWVSLISYYFVFLVIIRKNKIDFTSNVSDNSFSNNFNIFYDPSLYLNNSCGFPNIKSSLISKIINGNPTVAHSFPWMVSIGYNRLNNSFQHICGGSLISNQYVLTAAQCVYGPVISALVGQSNTNQSLISMGRIYLGIHSRLNDSASSNVFKFSKVIIHPYFLYNTSNLEYDLALIKLSSNVSFSDNISIICLNNQFDLQENQPVYAIGWGQTDPNVWQLSNTLLEATLFILNFDLCALRWKAQPNTQICAGTIANQLMQNTCSGDTGGPLMIRSSDSTSRWFLVGVTSIGNKPCNGLSLYTKIKYFYDWIVISIASSQVGII